MNILFRIKNKVDKLFKGVTYLSKSNTIMWGHHEEIICFYDLIFFICCYLSFATLSEDRVKLNHTDGKEYPVEIGAVFWIRVWDMP